MEFKNVENGENAKVQRIIIIEKQWIVKSQSKLQMKFFFGIRNTNNSGKMETEFGCTQEINFKHFHIFTRLNVRFQSYEVILHASLLRNGMVNDSIVVIFVSHHNVVQLYQRICSLVANRYLKASTWSINKSVSFNKVLKKKSKKLRWKSENDSMSMRILISYRDRRFHFNFYEFINEFFESQRKMLINTNGICIRHVHIDCMRLQCWRIYAPNKTKKKTNSKHIENMNSVKLSSVSTNFDNSDFIVFFL